MAIPSFFKQNKPRGFNYTPRYYDPDKEEREARRKAMGLDTGEREKKGGDQRAYRPSIRRGSMRNYFHYKKERTQKYTMIRLIVIVLVLILVTYLYLRF